MLARVAESLYWMGRYIERGEHLSRYIGVEFFSTLDYPMLGNQDFTLRSILFMSSADIAMDESLTENKVWQKVLFDNTNSNSIFSTLKMARENARSVRNNISIELWEAINKLYIFCKTYKSNNFSSDKMFSFCDEIGSYTAIEKTALAKSMLRDDKWHFIRLGIHIERATQVLRILRSKISDSNILSDNGSNKALLQYQWTTLLKSLEAFDIHSSHNRGNKITSDSIFRLVFSNKLFPRSLAYTASQIKFHLKNISVQPEGYTIFLEDFLTRKDHFIKFNQFSELDSVIEHIDETTTWLASLHSEIEKIYFQ